VGSSERRSARYVRRVGPRDGHTHATQLLKAGVHPKVVSERLGHASIGITLMTLDTGCRVCRH